MISGGESTTSVGGDISLTSGLGVASSSGAFTLLSADDIDNGVISGGIQMKSGHSTSGNSGTVTLRTEAATSGTAGSISIIVGSGSNFAGGRIVLESGQSMSATGGSISMTSGYSLQRPVVRSA